MKKTKYLLTLILSFSIVSCDSGLINGSMNISSSDSNNTDTFTSSSDIPNSNSDTDNNDSILNSSSSDKNQDADSSSSTSDKEPEINQNPTPTNYFTIDENGIVDTYTTGQSFAFDDKWINYIVLDNVGRVFFTVANPKAGYGETSGENSMHYSHPIYQNDVVNYINNSNRTFTIPNDCIGYSITFEAYGNFAYELSDGIVSSTHFEDSGNSYIGQWNSLSNPWFDESIGVVIGFTTTEQLTIKNAEQFRLSSLYDNASSIGVTTYKMFAPYDDKYTISSSDTTEISVYNNNKYLIARGTSSCIVTLNKNDIIYIKLVTNANIFFNIEVTLTNNNVELPYEINSSVDISKYSTTSSSTASPLTAATLNYTKRSDDRGLYVNSNNPENLTNYQNEYGSILNTVLMRQDVTEKDVFFTFEHNNLASNYYYGYRLTNTGSDDVYVTIKNLGYQVDGAGSWLGEDEWIKFYNTKFYSDTSGLTSSQLSNYQAFVGFSNNYESENRKPITYRIPSGKYFYVMGGTTADAYQNINVFNSANKIVNGGCSNAAVLFSVTGGSAEASFMLYTDENAATINATDYVTGNNQIGYVSDEHFGSQYGGYDNCHGVVDADIVYTFNDATASDYLPVTYTNPYTSTTTSGTAYGKISNLTAKKFSTVWSWYTNISFFDNQSAIGTDMTDYINVDYKTKEVIEIDSSHYDGRGKVPNIGNWMVDYIDTFTLVNQGNKDREFTYSLQHNGVILAFIRDENGFIDENFTPRYYTSIAANAEYGDEVRQYFSYTVIIPAHSIARFSVDYNLLANSYGSIMHRAYLK